MKLLAIETATNVCSVVLKNKDGKLFEERSEVNGVHSENVFLFIQQLMDEHRFDIGDIETILWSEGPGSYTGLRIAASGIKGLLFERDIPLYGVNTLASFAMGIPHEQQSCGKIHAVIDARRKHLYYQSFLWHNGHLAAQDEPKIRSIKEIESRISPHEIVVGTGLNRLDEALLEQANSANENSISAHSLIQLYEAPQTDSLYRKVKAAAFSPKYYNEWK